VAARSGDQQPVARRASDLPVLTSTHPVAAPPSGNERDQWWGSVLDESEPLEEHMSRPRLSRVSPATQAVGPVEDEWLRDNLLAVTQPAESLDRGSFERAMRIVPLDWCAAQLPDRPSLKSAVLNAYRS
jgi:hypothetical protein